MKLLCVHKAWTQEGKLKRITCHLNYPNMMPVKMIDKQFILNDPITFTLKTFNFELLSHHWILLISWLFCFVFSVLLLWVGEETELQYQPGWMPNNFSFHSIGYIITLFWKLDDMNGELYTELERRYEVLNSFLISRILR